MQIQSNINGIGAAMPFLLALTNEERQGGLKLGDKTVAFIDKAIDYACSNPTLVPPYVNLEEIQKDYQLQKDLVDILQWLASGMTHAEILEDYPLLKEEHILAALAFAANRESIIKIIAT